MISEKAWLKKIVKDWDLFIALYLSAEEKVLRKHPEGNEFGIGFLMGFWLGRFYESRGVYGSREADKSVHTTKNSDREQDS